MVAFANGATRRVTNQKSAFSFQQVSNLFRDFSLLKGTQISRTNNPEHVERNSFNPLKIGELGSWFLNRPTDTSPSERTGSGPETASTSGHDMSKHANNVDTAEWEKLELRAT